MPISEGSTSRTRTRRRTAEAGSEGSNDDVRGFTGVMHCWSSPYGALIGKDTQDWFMSDGIHGMGLHTMAFENFVVLL
jgi:hypothetical protein